MNANLYARFAAGFEPGRLCLEDRADGRGYRCEDVDRASAQAAHALRELGVRAGDRVSVIAEKSAALVWLYLGALRAGAIWHPLNPTYTERELAFFLGNAETRLAICDPALRATVEAAAAASGELVGVETLDARGEGTFPEASRDAADAFETCVSAPDDVAALLYSSGTTGTPKGIPLTHDNLYANARALVDAWEFSAADVLVHALPVYHVHGLFITLGPALLAGTRLRWLARFEPGAVLEALSGATMMAGVPTYYTRLLDEPGLDRAACASVRVFISGSAPLRKETFAAFEARTGHRILERYGMTETGINASNPLHGERVPGAVGPALPGVELRVTGDDGRTLDSGQIGDVEVRGPNVFRGYWRLPERDGEAFTADRYFRTGDQGLLDDAGYLHIVGRSKDMVITGGLNVYPKEVETLLDGLDGVGESAVFGVPHGDFGEAVVAAVVSAADAVVDEDALRGAAREALAAFKVPKRIIEVDALPRNAMGKVQKNLLRERFERLFAADAES